MKGRQSAKIREIADALIGAGFLKLDEQAKALDLGRSTAWALLKNGYKNSGISAAIIRRILSSKNLPDCARAKILEYVEEKAAGLYGHKERTCRKFITRLLADRLERADLEAIFRLPVHRRPVRIAAALSHVREQHCVSIGNQSARTVARLTPSIDHRSQRLRKAL